MAEIIDNTARNSTRRDAMLRMYTKVALNFTYDANGILVFNANTRTLFSKGIDDSSGTYDSIGYSTVPGATDDIEVTNAGKGGSFSNQYDTLILSVGFFPERAPRVGIDAAGAALATFTSSVSPRGTGVTGSREQLIYNELVTCAFGGSQLTLLPTNKNEGCQTYLGIPQLAAPGTGWQESGLTQIGQHLPSARYTFATPVLVAPNRDNSDMSPNRIQWSWSSNQTGCERAVGQPARASGVVVVLDMVCVVDLARVVVEREAGVVKKITPVDDIDLEKLNAFGCKV